MHDSLKYIIDSLMIKRNNQQPTCKKIDMLERSISSTFYLPKSLQSRSISSGDKQLYTRKSYSILDAKKIKTRIAELFKSDQMRKSESSMYKTHSQAQNQLKNNQKKKMIKDSVKIGIQKRKIRDIYHRRVVNHEKMQIIGNDIKQQINKIEQPALQPEYIKNGKTTPTSQSASYQLIATKQVASSPYKILTVGRNRVFCDNFKRKPSLPVRNIEIQQIPSNNFLKTRKYFKPRMSKQLGFCDDLQPWSKIEDEHIFLDFS